MVKSYGTSAVGACDGATTVAVDMTLPPVTTSPPATTRSAGGPSVPQDTAGAIQRQEIVLTRFPLMTRFPLDPFSSSTPASPVGVCPVNLTFKAVPRCAIMFLAPA
jgi:hypothetical protein